MRKMASIQVIEEIQPIEGADKICAYRIKGWWVVDQINNYVVGDRVIFCEVDSWIPHELAPFLSKSSGPREYLGVLGNKLRTVRLRKQLSQGLILPLHKMGEYTQYEVEDDVSEVLGIVKYDPPQRGGMTGMPRGNFPSFIRKTDQERCVAKGTMVATNKGSIPIEELCLNYQEFSVMSFDHNNETTRYNNILGVKVSSVVSEWFEITTASGNIVVVTGEHKIFNNDLLCYRDAKNLKIGDSIIII